jgi:hypothetical protein
MYHSTHLDNFDSHDKVLPLRATILACGIIVDVP